MKNLKSWHSVNFEARDLDKAIHLNRKIYSFVFVLVLHPMMTPAMVRISQIFTNFLLNRNLWCMGTCSTSICSKTTYSRSLSAGHLQ